jgi:hypothetical protein
MSAPSGIVAGLTVCFLLLAQVSCQRPPSPASPKSAVPREILEVDSSRQRPLVIAYNPSSRPALPPDSRLTVFDDGEIKYRVSTWKICSKDDGKNCLGPALWFYRWDDTHERVFQGKLDAAELDHLRTLLNSDDVKHTAGYANAGPSVGDFRISIHRGDRQQWIVVVGFNPGYGWQPPLTDLICEAKVIAQSVPAPESLPDWCRNRPQH